MKKWIARLFLGLLGWKVKARVSPEMHRSVMVAAPHTSNWDFPIALAAFWIMGLDLKYFIKDDYTRGILGGFFRWTGAIGVNRRNPRNNLTQQAIHLLKERDLVLMVPAEGTRRAVEKWRTGFYHIAREAQVPISLGTLDYRAREADIIDVFTPTGDFKKDMQYIQECYRPIHPRHPEGYNPQIF